MLNEPLVRLTISVVCLAKTVPLNGDFFSVISDEEWNPYTLRLMVQFAVKKETENFRLFLTAFQKRSFLRVLRGFYNFISAQYLEKFFRNFL